MSRVIVKNLPKRINEERLKTLFGSQGGQITDVQLKYSKDGKFRQFGFVGFKKEREAKAAVEYLHDTFVDTSKIQVELCSELGDVDQKPRSWSKYSKDSSSYQKKHAIEQTPKKDVESENIISKSDDLLTSLKNDPEFHEFLEAHRKVDQKQIWGNDEGNKIDSDVGDENSESDDEDKASSIASDDVVVNPKLSDLDYLKSKVVQESNNDGEESQENRNVRLKKSKIANDEGFTVKLRNLPYKCKKKDIKDFFGPVKLTSLRLPPKIKGIAYAQFKTEKAFKAALNKHHSILSGHRIDVVKYVKQETGTKNDKNQEKVNKWEELTEKLKSNEDAETVAESGRLFVRNLSYTCTEDELENHFKKYGPLSEVNLPIDRFTRKLKGFGFITYMIPEHAVKAFAELDGCSFQGRILHILPSKIKKSPEELQEKDGESFKKKLINQKKATSSSSHNWNALFLGANAVTDVMADKYNTPKSKILDTELSGSIAVRVALGETQIVNETHDFLVKHGVNLDEFKLKSSERSKVVILAKNLPAGTASTELKSLFGKYGVVKSVLLPPAGITAIVEMEEPSEARAAFRKLAYTKFHDIPLYLEWAPVNVFRENREEISDDTNPASDVNKTEKEETDEHELADEDANIFVKSLNFSSTEDALHQHFKRIGKVHSVTIMRKKSNRNGDAKNLSMGYGFVHYKKKEDALTAIKQLQHSTLDDHCLELKLSTRATISSKTNLNDIKTKQTKQKSSKILVRNIPFEAKRKEVEDLFKVFGELRAVRLPKKLTGSHRGFAFVDFLTKNDAKRAFKALSQSTHLYGRRIVLEWAESEEDVETMRRKTAEHFYAGGSKAKKSKKAIADDSMIQSSVDMEQDSGN